MNKTYDVIIVGAGHNGLVAAVYLALAGKKVLMCESTREIGGASTSVKAFPDYEANLSRYAYLVSLFPDKILKDLDLKFTTLSRPMSSYTPYRLNGRPAGLRISRKWDTNTEESFSLMEGGRTEAKTWRWFYGGMETLAKRLAPSLLEPLPTRAELRAHVGMDDVWRMVFDRPIGETLLEKFHSDLVRGIILTDGLIGTHTSAFDLQANRCLLYHLVGNGSGEWKVPKGGMGALINELKQKAIKHGVEIRTNARVVNIHTQSSHAEVHLDDNTVFRTAHILCNAAPQVLAKLMGKEAPSSREGSQLKINLLLKKLPRFKSGFPSTLGFSGTLHINESMSELEKAFEDSRQGRLPRALPLEMYCHTLTDPSILSKELQFGGYHTLTMFALHTPASLFKADNRETCRELTKQAFAALNAHLEDPIESCIAQTAEGDACVEVKSPLDLEGAIGLPKGNIFHKDLSFPFMENKIEHRWGVETEDPRILICGSGAVRGGGVSGIPGHNAAMKLLGK
jgi:phytoene dehydrogenase-like protein